MPYYDNFPNTYQYWESLLDIVIETENLFQRYLGIDNPPPELSRQLAELFINNAGRMLTLPAASVNPEVLNLVDQYVDCYHAFSNYYYETADFWENDNNTVQENKDFLNNPFTYVGGIFEGFIGGLTGYKNTFGIESTFDRFDNEHNANTQKAEELLSSGRRLFNNYRLLFSRTIQLNDRLFS